MFKIFDFFETSFIFERLSKLFLSIFSKISDKFSLPNLIFCNLNLLSPSKLPDSVSIRVFLFFSVVISFADALSWFGSQHYFINIIIKQLLLLFLFYLYNNAYICISHFLRNLTILIFFLNLLFNEII